VRVALVGPSWPFRGGIARTTTALAAALARRRSLATFAVPRRQYPRLFFPGASDRDSGACPRLDQAQPSYGVLEPWSWGRAARLLRSSSPDALALPFWTWAWAPLQRYLLHAVPAPAVAIVHNPADHGAGAVRRRAARTVLTRCDAFLCHAESVAALLREGFPGRPLAVHPLPAVATTPGERDAARDALGVGEDVVAVLCFGILRPYKGVDVLLQALARLPASSRVLVLLAGEPWGETRGQLRRLLADARIAGRVRARLGWVPEPELATWLAAADAAVLPYRSATGSAVAAQVLGLGLPVVASRVGGLPDVVEDGGNGLLVPPGDVAALAGALERLEEDPLRARLAAGATARAARCTWASYADALEDLVTRVLTDSPRNPAH
jgi:glycosyltransferase involved in cell wall biosynthesis